MNIRKYQPSTLHPFESLFSDWRRTNPGWWPAGQEQGGKAAPSVDIEEKDDRYIVRADLPGVNKDDIEVSVDDGVLTISASCESEDKEEEDDAEGPDVGLRRRYIVLAVDLAADPLGRHEVERRDVVRRELLAEKA